jgi:hypothetical protein
MRIAAALIAFMTIASAAHAQMQPPPLEEMKKFEFLAGDWEGTGWMAFGPGQRQESRVEEHAEYKLGGAVLVLEGVGCTGEPGTGSERIVHNAFGVVSYDRHKGDYTMRAYRGDGQFVDAWIKPGDNGLTWGFDVPGMGAMRYTLVINEKGQWHEVGEMSRDSGANWNQFFEMTLDKKM